MTTPAIDKILKKISNRNKNKKLRLMLTADELFTLHDALTKNAAHNKDLEESLLQTLKEKISAEIAAHQAVFRRSLTEQQARSNQAIEMSSKKAEAAPQEKAIILTIAECGSVSILVTDYLRDFGLDADSETFILENVTKEQAKQINSDLNQLNKGLAIQRAKANNMPVPAPKDLPDVQYVHTAEQHRAAAPEEQQAWNRRTGHNLGDAFNNNSLHAALRIPKRTIDFINQLAEGNGIKDISRTNNDIPNLLTTNHRFFQEMLRNMNTPSMHRIQQTHRWQHFAAQRRDFMPVVEITNGGR